MSRILHKLSAKGIESVSHDGKDFKLFDGGGLFLHVQKSGKYWRLKYRYTGKEKILSLGVYPEVTLSEARKKKNEAREILSKGIDPKEFKETKLRKQISTASNTFQAIALEWYKEFYQHKVTKGHAKSNLDRLEKYIFPQLGNRPISEITAPELLAVLKVLEKKGILETALRVKSLCGQIFRYAIATARASRDPASDLKGVLRTPEEKHHPAIIDPKEIGQLLEALDCYSGYPSTCSALRLAPLLFVRPGELRQAKWKDFDLDSAIWNYQPSKGGLPFEFPLSTQAIQILKEHFYITGDGEYVFPSVRSR
jgi:integrase